MSVQQLKTDKKQKDKVTVKRKYSFNSLSVNNFIKYVAAQRN